MEKKWDKQIIENKILDIFKSLKLKYTEVTMNDNDLNYLINIDGTIVMPGMDTLEILMFFSTDFPKCTIMLGNVYNFKESTQNAALKIANRINTKLNSGKVVVYDQPKQLIYLDSRSYSSFSDLTKETISSLINGCYIALAVIYNDIKVLENEE